MRTESVRGTQPGVHRAPRVLVAVDGSDGSEIALQLTAQMRWPPGTRVVVLTAVHALPRIMGELLPVTPVDANRTVRLFKEAARRDGRAAPRVRRLLVEGSPEQSIVEAAHRLRVDLIVVGSRGRSPLATAVLGSVASAVVDKAARPVLVARSTTTARIVVADDGSACADRAGDWLLQWPLFEGSQVRVTSVASWTSDGGHEDALTEAKRVALARQEALIAGGMAAGSEVVEGEHPARRILEVAAGWADLIVVGCRGRTGVRRLLLGSVARSVLAEAPCSVLVVKERWCC